MSALHAQAIQTALMGNWESAILLNKKLLKDDPHNIEALNRLAFAFLVMSKTRHAKEAYQRVLAIDKLNPIALRGLKRLNNISKKLRVAPSAIANGEVRNMFLEETGRTKVVELINIAQPKTIAGLRTGEYLTISIKRFKVFVYNPSHQYVGMVPDNIGKRLIKLLRGGNCYEAHVKSIDNHHVTVFMKETKRAARFRNQPSFIHLERSRLMVRKQVKMRLQQNNRSDDKAQDDEEDERHDDDVGSF